jgi:hypothetical protein
MEETPRVEIIIPPLERGAISFPGTGVLPCKFPLRDRFARNMGERFGFLFFQGRDDPLQQIPKRSIPVSIVPDPFRFWTRANRP